MNTAAEIQVVPPSRMRRLFEHGVVRFVGAVLVVLVAALTPEGVIHSLVAKPFRPVWPEFLSAAVALLAYRWYVRQTERREADEVSALRLAPQLGAGLALGFVLVGAVIAALAAVGAYRLDHMNGWSFALVKPIGEMVFVGTLEELLFRAILFRMAERAWGRWPALALTSVLFALAHIPGDPTLVALAATAMAGVLLTAAYMVTGRLWLSIGFHAGWNYTLGTVWSIAVSGHEAKEGLFSGQLSGPQWLTGGAYGLEGSALTLAALTIAAAILLRRGGVRYKPR